MTIALIIFLSLVAAGGGVWLFLKTSGLAALLRGLIALAPASLAALALYLIWLLAAAPTVDWNGGRLAPAFGLTRGIALYQDRDTGVMTGWTYGPISALLFLPASMASRPTSAILIGVAINLLCVIVPAGWIFVASLGSGVNILRVSIKTVAFTLFTMVVVVWLLMDYESLRLCTTMVGPDGPALGLTACSIAVLFRGNDSIRLSMSALCAGLAVWSKQSTLPVLLAAPLYLLLAEGWKVSLRSLALNALSMALLSAILLMAFGAGNVWFHMITLPASQSWQGRPDLGTATILFRRSMRMLNEIVPTGACIGLLLLIERYLAPSSRRHGLRSWCCENRWLMLPMTAVLLAPASALGVSKIGGSVSNLGLPHYFLVMTVGALLDRLYLRSVSPATTSDPVDPDAARARDALRNIVLLLAGLGAFWHAAGTLLPKHKAAEMCQTIAKLYDNPQEIVYRFSVKQPGTVYFPSSPLPVLLAEGKLYHSEWGLIDRTAAKLKTTESQIRAHLPAKLSAVAFGPGHQSEHAMQLFGKTPMTTVTHDDLPGFTIYMPTNALQNATAP